MSKRQEERLFPFIRGYEKLVKEYGLKLDIVDENLCIVDLGPNFIEDPHYYIYFEGLSKQVENDYIQSSSKKETK